jgi:hypothetical protein
MMLKIGNFGKWIRNTWKILKRGAGDERKGNSWTDATKNEKNIT